MTKRCCRVAIYSIFDTFSNCDVTCDVKRRFPGHNGSKQPKAACAFHAEHSGDTASAKTKEHVKFRGILCLA